MKVLLTGASGFLGKQIFATLQADGHTVMPATRALGFDFNVLLDEKDWLAYLQGIDAVINAVGIISETRSQSFARLHYQAPTALFRACVEAGVRRVIQISALGADASAATPYHKSKKAADDVLRSLPLEWFVLRPSLVYGPGGKSLALFRRIALLPVIPVPAHGRQKIQPVHIRDLVEAVQRCLTVSPSGRTIDVVGASPVTYIHWLQLIRRANGKTPGPVVSLPFSLTMAVAHIVKPFIPMLHPDNLRMLQQNNTSAVESVAGLLGRLPLRPEDCDAEDFR